MNLPQTAPSTTPDPDASGKTRFNFLTPAVTKNCPYVLDAQSRTILENALKTDVHMMAYWTEKYSMVNLVKGWLMTPNSGSIKLNKFAQFKDGNDLVNQAQGPALAGGGTAKLEIANWSRYRLAQGEMTGQVLKGPGKVGTTDPSVVPLPGIRISSPQGLKRLQLFMPTIVNDAGTGIAVMTALGAFAWPVVKNVSTQVLDTMQNWIGKTANKEGEELADGIEASTDEIVTSEAEITAPVEVVAGEEGSAAAAGMLEGVEMSSGLTGLVVLGIFTWARLATRSKHHPTTLDLEVVNELSSDIGWSVVNTHSDGNLVLQSSPTLPAAGILTQVSPDGTNETSTAPVAHAADFKFSNGEKGNGPLQIVMTLGLGDGPGTPVAIAITGATSAPAAMKMDLAGTPTTARANFSQVVKITVGGKAQSVTVDVQVSQSPQDLATDPMNPSDPSVSKGMCYCYGLIRIRPTP